MGLPEPCAASSSTSIVQRPCPTFAIWPSWTRISLSTPSNGEVISTLALSDWTSQRGSKVATAAEGFADLHAVRNDTAVARLVPSDDLTLCDALSHICECEPVESLCMLFAGRVEAPVGSPYETMHPGQK